MSGPLVTQAARRRRRLWRKERPAAISWPPRTRRDDKPGPSAKRELWRSRIGCELNFSGGDRCSLISRGRLSHTTAGPTEWLQNGSKTGTAGSPALPLLVAVLASARISDPGGPSMSSTPTGARRATGRVVEFQRCNKDEPHLSNQKPLPGCCPSASIPVPRMHRARHDGAPMHARVQQRESLPAPRSSVEKKVRRSRRGIPAEPPRPTCTTAAFWAVKLKIRAVAEKPCTPNVSAPPAAKLSWFCRPPPQAVFCFLPPTRQFHLFSLLSSTSLDIPPDRRLPRPNPPNWPRRPSTPHVLCCSPVLSTPQHLNFVIPD